jgi:glucose/arabinose dehydrogenase
VRVNLRLTAVLAVLVAAVLAPSAHAAVSLVSDGTFSNPIYATAPRADATSLYVVQRGGQIRIVRNGATLAQPFLDLTPEVDSSVGESGLLSMAFSTDYSTSGLFYVYMTPNDPTPGAAPYAPIELREYRRSASNPDRADPASGRIVLSVPHPANSNHYGGTLQFGSDGRLYMGTGDGGGSGDSDGNAQNPESMLGKLLRLDPRRTGNSAYGVPRDNPLATRPTTQLLWSTGLRNPFRFSFDRSTDALALADVGQNRYEEIDFAGGPAAGRGLNFGWRTCEASATYPSGALGTCTTPGLTGPVFAYGHDGSHCSITGGVVSRDPGVEELAGRYLYGDYCGSDIRSQALGNPGSDASTGLSGSQPVAFGEDACGRVHLVRLGGAVGRLSDGSTGPCALRAEFTPPPTTPAANAPLTSLGKPVRVKTRISKRQRVLRHRYLKLRVACATTCSLRVSSSLRVRGQKKALRLRDLKVKKIKKARTLKVRVGRKARRAIRRALRAKRRVTVKLSVRARGGSGRLTLKRLSTRVVG